MTAGDIAYTTETKHRRFEVYERKDGEFGWREINKTTGENIASSGEGFASADEAQGELEGAIHAAKAREEPPAAA